MTSGNVWRKSLQKRIQALLSKTRQSGSSMSVLIVGIGALGCLFAARLAGSGCPVTMLGSWPDGLAALRKNGVRLLEMDGRSHNYPVELMAGSECQGDFSHALVLVKAWQTERAAQQLEHCLSEDGLALTLQNGLGNYETLCNQITP